MNTHTHTHCLGTWTLRVEQPQPFQGPIVKFVLFQRDTVTDTPMKIHVKCVCVCVFPCLLLGCHARLCLKCADLLDATASNLGHCFTHPRRGEEIRACSRSSIGPQTLNPKTLNPSLPLMKPFPQRRATAQAYAKQFKAQVQ